MKVCKVLLTRFACLTASSSSLVLPSIFVMDSSKVEVDYEFLPYFRGYKDGRIIVNEYLPPWINPQSGFSSKDVFINKEIGLCARLYIPTVLHKRHKLPLLIYFNGGGFCTESAFSPFYYNYLNMIVAKANVVAVSVEYRLAPEHPVPIAYNDSWEAILWVASHSKGEGPDVLMPGFSWVEIVQVPIVHNMAMRVGEVEMTYAPSLSNLGCTRVLVFLAGKDYLNIEGCYTMKNSGCGGMAEVIETKGEDHVFHLKNPTGDKAISLMKSLSSFINQNNLPT
ncbi:hypothetical protein AQUCO_00700605v1 [Aquilegia coerulea]|uniref:Alpha/beta hydrolase fold-3 domain-containing protein n=1 Tax=Aquilegia coerulea TaxID=218851 RepID=A0A2G5EKX0_AQUCA|nr:hypothetical protein AQUCO_00700605v1 [Aquilegia coerulea]